MKNQVILVVDDDPSTTESLAMSLEADSRTVITCNDIECAKTIMERTPLSMILSDVKFSGPFGFEGLEFVPHIGRHAPDTAIVLMTGASSDPLREEAKKRGAIAVLEKPFGPGEVEAILARKPDGGSLLPDETPSVIRIPPLEELMNSDNLICRFQPIITLANDSYEPIGFESLLRLKEPIPLVDPVLLFSYAEKKGAVAELEFASIARSLRLGAPLTRLGKLFLNLHPQAFAHRERLVETVSSTAAAHGIALEQLVFEITEQGGFIDHAKALESIRALGSLGVNFAFDDVGIAYSHLAMIDQIKPKYLKISQYFGTGCEADPTKLKLIRNILSLGADFHCSVILEGIETGATAAFVRRLPVPYAQGFYYSRALDASAFLK